VAAAGLGLALNRLMAGRHLAEWLDWPTDRFAILPAGALFFACRSDSWAGRQLLRGALLAALVRPHTRLVVYGFPWGAGEIDDLWLHNSPQAAGDRPVLVSNGPLLPGAIVLLGQSGPAGAETLAARFLAGDPALVENLQLIGRQEVLVLGSAEDPVRAAFRVAWPVIGPIAGGSESAGRDPAAADLPAPGRGS
jgi:hypothetical protein